MNNSKKPTIIILENSVGYTGAFKAILQIAEDLQNNFNFIFVIPKNSLVKNELLQKQITTYEIPIFPLRRSIINIILYLPFLLLNAISLYKISKKENASLIISNDLYNLAPLLTKLFTFNKIKLISYVRFLSFAFPSLLFKTWIWANNLMADKIVCVSKAALTPIKESKKALVIYGRNPIQERYPYSDKMNNKDNISLLYLANYTKGKGQIIAIDAFKKVIAKLPNTKLTFIGDDFGIPKNKKFKEDLIKQASSIGVLQNIEFKNFEEDIEGQFKKHDIFLNLSYSESFSNTCLESLYFGTPCIATASGGPQEILQDGQFGILIYERDEEKVAEEIIGLAEDSGRRRQLSINGRAHVRDMFSIDNTSYKLRGVIYEILSQK